VSFDWTAPARWARTAAYRTASPIDNAWRRAAGRTPLPPLWLRRHAGDVRFFETAATETAAWIDRLGLLSGSRLVLDAGCGPGSMVEEFLKRLPVDGRYVGFDVHAPSIRWCRRRWAREPRAAFSLAQTQSPYGASRAPQTPYRFPVGDGETDLVLAKSLFTHLLEADARHYLSETRRALAPGRAAVITAFLFRADADGLETAFPHTAGNARVRSRARPSRAVAWEKERFVGMIEDAGLRLQWHSAGYYPGRPRLDAQDILLLGH